MNKEQFHQFVEDCWDEWLTRQPGAQAVERPLADTIEIEEPSTASVIEEAPKVEHNPDERMVRTKATGDKVYLINDKEKTKRWITSPEVLKGLGWELSEVVEIPDMELAQYRPVSAAFSA